MLEVLQRKVATGELSYIDAHFSALMARLADVVCDSQLASLFADLSRALTKQHSCLDLVDHPDKETLLAKLRQLAIVGTDDADTPLILDGARLYMQRYYRYEARIAAWLLEHNRVIDRDESKWQARLNELFGNGPSRQKEAALKALTRQIAIITGGPGTGKTSTVVKILDALLSESEDPLAIRLAAPTGKAAMRLAESLSTTTLPIDPEVQTLHRLLGMRGDGSSYRYGPHNPLPIDLLVVDEVSMVDLAMMHRLLGALPAHARLVLLGDPDQLPSVEAGNILGDICRPAASGHHQLIDAICQLDVSYRFSPDRGIGRLSHAIRTGSTPEWSSDDEVEMQNIAEMNVETFLSAYHDYLDLLSGSSDIEQLLDAFERSRILSPLREGDDGVASINDRIEQHLIATGVIDGTQPFYHGRPILITRNDYNLRLFNGDVGICIHDEGLLEPRVVFRDAAGKSRQYLASRLPMHETCFAMTVHKAQGSEFNHVLLVLPQETSDQAQQLMTRELVYTAVTRAREKMTLFATPARLAKCLQNRTVRHSGLGERFVAAARPSAKKPVDRQLDLFN